MTNLKKQLSDYYNPKLFFVELANDLAQASKALPDPESQQIDIVIDEIITGVEDAWLNSLASASTPKHIRYHRAEDLIAAASDYFTLVGYERKQERLILAVTDSASVQEQLASLPENIADLLQAELAGDKLSLIVWRGTLRFSLL